MSGARSGESITAHMESAGKGRRAAEDPLPTPRPELTLLGGFALTIGGQPVSVPESSQRVLVYLALHDRPQARQVVAASLWPESGEARAAANLRSSLWRLPTPNDQPLYTGQGSNLAVAPEVDVDVRRVEAAGWSLVQNATTQLDLSGRRMFFDDLLPGWYDDFVIVERERLAQLRLHFLEAMAHALGDQGRFAEALDVALRLVAADPLRERSQKALISMYRAEGSIGQAVRQYERYQDLLQETFGCDPSAELAQLAYGLSGTESVGA